jgi:integrase
VTVFTGGVNIGQREAATHIAGVSARELSIVRNRHIDLGKLLCAAIAAVVSAFAELDVVQAWGDGTAVAADGMHVEAYIDNLAVGADVGIPGLRPHRCRQTYGTRLRQGGADSAQVQALLGHASLDTAARYFRSGSAENAAVIERTFDR